MKKYIVFILALLVIAAIVVLAIPQKIQNTWTGYKVSADGTIHEGQTMVMTASRCRLQQKKYQYRNIALEINGNVYSTETLASKLTTYYHEDHCSITFHDFVEDRKTFQVCNLYFGQDWSWVCLSTVEKDGSVCYFVASNQSSMTPDAILDICSQCIQR